MLSSRTARRQAGARRLSVAWLLEGTKGVPRNGGRNWLDRVLLSILYMFKPSC